MSKNFYGLRTIEMLVLVGIVGLMLFIAAKSYRSYLISIEVNNSNSDFDNVAKVIRRELVEIKKFLEQQPKDRLNIASQRLDSSQEWFALVSGKIDLKTDKVIITSINGTIADENLIVRIGLRSEGSIIIKQKSICWESLSAECS